MKKFFLLILSICLLPSCFCAQKYTTQEELQKIADDTQNCIDTNYMTDYTMALCVIEGTKKYELEIDKITKNAQNYLLETQYNKFSKQQKKWEKSLKKI